VRRGAGGRGKIIQVHRDYLYRIRLEFNADGSIDTDEDRQRWLFSNRIVARQPKREGTFEI
jgi:hypothetical protein